MGDNTSIRASVRPSVRAAVACFIASLFCTYQFMLQGSTSVMLPGLMQGLDIDLSGVGWVSSAFLYVYLMFQVPGGVVADRFDGRWVLCLCCLLLAIACYWFAHARNFTEATMARAMMGIATSPGIVVCMSLVARWFPLRWFPVLSGMVESMAVLGGGLGPLVLPVLMAAGGWRHAMEVVAASGVVLAVLVGLLVRNGPEVESGRDPDSEPYETCNWSLLLKNRRFWCYCLYGFGCFVMVNSFAGLWGIPFMTDRYPENPRLAQTSVSLIFIGLAIGAPLIGGLVTLFGHCRRFMLASVVAQIVFALLIIYGNSSIQGMCLLCFLAGLSCGGYLLVFAMISDMVSSEIRGVAMAVANGFMLLGAPVVQPLIGKCLEWLSEDNGYPLSVACYRQAFVVILVCQMLALGCAVASMCCKSD